MPEVGDVPESPRPLTLGVGPREADVVQHVVAHGEELAPLPVHLEPDGDTADEPGEQPGARCLGRVADRGDGGADRKREFAHGAYLLAGALARDDRMTRRLQPGICGRGGYKRNECLLWDESGLLMARTDANGGVQPSADRVGAAAKVDLRRPVAIATSRAGIVGTAMTISVERPGAARPPQPGKGGRRGRFTP